MTKVARAEAKTEAEPLVTTAAAAAVAAVARWRQRRGVTRQSVRVFWKL